MTAGFTETGGMQRFLRKIRPDAEWTCCFPAVQKPGPKPGKALPRPDESGVSGPKLREMALKRLRDRRGRDADLDLVLFVDDGDCRFCGQDLVAATRAWEAAFRAEVAAALGRDVPVVVLFAHPEVEAWFLLDPDQRRTLLPWKPGSELDLVDLDRGTWGCPEVNGSCSRKLSAEIAEARKVLGLPEYSKRRQGPDLLVALDPARLAARMPGTFGDAYRRLQTTPPREVAP